MLEIDKRKDSRTRNYGDRGTSATSFQRRQSILVPPKVLLLVADEQERNGLDSLLSPYVALTCVQGLRALLAHLKRGRYDALFCVCSFHSKTWNAPLKHVRKRHPELPVILLSSANALREWPDVFEAGAFDFLVPPYSNHNLLAVVEQAVASTEARCWHNTEANGTSI